MSNMPRMRSHFQIILTQYRRRTLVDIRKISTYHTERELVFFGLEYIDHTGAVPTGQPIVTLTHPRPPTLKSSRPRRAVAATDININIHHNLTVPLLNIFCILDSPAQKTKLAK